ncbi:MAG: protocatechuate 3,4-dioxygenase subunit beta [Gemmatimonadota bacterium]
MNDITPYRRPFWNTQPADRFDAYVATQSRSPSQPLVPIRQTLSEVTGPLFGAEFVQQGDSDLTAHGSGAPIGQRIVVHGRVLDENGRPVRNTLIEVWQANAAGRYRHQRDQWDAPLDPNFVGEGRMLTDGDGRYRFLTIRPGSYPWGNHHNAWRPAHIHFSLFGNAYATRLVTQMYFPGDDMLPFDPIFNSTPDPNARNRLIARLDWASTVPGYAHAFEFDIVLRGRDRTPMESRSPGE